MKVICAKLARCEMVKRACSGCMAEVCCNAIRNQRAMLFKDLVVEGKGIIKDPHQSIEV
jgi:hypothetical protein